MNGITKKCRVSGEEFLITEEDQNFYRRMGVPEPSLCPGERLRRRLAFRNEHNLYKRRCNVTGKPIISIYAPDLDCDVYEYDYWWGDEWNALNYGREFDFSRGFFEQFAELWRVVPRMALIKFGDNVNCEYSHNSYKVQNCFLVFDGEQAVDCLYGETYSNIKSCLDFHYLHSSEFCYECLHCEGGYNLFYSRFCQNCSDSFFLMDCRGCRNCVGCVNLQQKQYCIFNEQYSQEEYEEKLRSFRLNTASGVKIFRATVEQFFLEQPRKYMRSVMTENVSGDNLFECQNVFESFDCRLARDCKFCTNIQLAANDCYDVDIWGDDMSLVYDSAGIGGGSHNVVGSYYVGMGSSNVFYSIFCFPANHDLFGCVGLRHKKYCILNKQYSKEEYEELVPRIVEKMKNDGEWGEFFPTEMSAFAYNETVAQDYFPLTKEEVLARGWKWRDQVGITYDGDCCDFIPDDINDVSDDICGQVVKCEVTGKPFKITPQELKFYREMQIPVPRKCFDQRHKERMELRNPRQLWERDCAKCGVEVLTSYAPERPEIVYCEKCYLDRRG